MVSKHYCNSYKHIGQLSELNVGSMACLQFSIHQNPLHKRNRQVKWDDSFEFAFVYVFTAIASFCFSIIRTHFTYEQTEHAEMAFRSGDVFHVVDTLYGGVVGSWQAHRVSLRTHQESNQRGIIPNRSRYSGDKYRRSSYIEPIIIPNRSHS